MADPSFKVLKEKKLGPVNVLFRLTKEDTLFLKKRIDEAIEKNTGANLIMHQLEGSIRKVYTDKHREQIFVRAYKGLKSFNITTPMKGYEGRWSHVEIVMPLSFIPPLKDFLDDL